MISFSMAQVSSFMPGQTSLHSAFHSRKAPSAMTIPWMPKEVPASQGPTAEAIFMRSNRLYERPHELINATWASKAEAFKQFNIPFNIDVISRYRLSMFHRCFMHSLQVKTTYLLSTSAVAGYLAREDGKSRALGHASEHNEVWRCKPPIANISV